MAWQGRRLGSRGPEITPVGFGAWAVGGDWAFGWGPQDDEASIAAIHAALDAGVSWIDTAAVYGLGHSEEVVARALEGISDRPLVFTKCGMVWQDQADGVPRVNLRPEHIRRECEDSPAPPARGGHRPLPVPLARREHGDAGGGVVGGDGRPRRRGQGAARRGLQLRRRAARADRADHARGQPPAAVQRHPARRGGRRDPVVRRQRHRRHRVQPDDERPPDRALLEGADGVARRGRLAPRLPRVPGAAPSRATSPSRTRCGPSPSATAPRSPPSRSRGPSPGPG